MSLDDAIYRAKQLPPKAIAAGVVGVLLVLVLVWSWWPSPAPSVDPVAQRALDAIKADPEANKQAPEVPPPSADSGPRRKATKVN